MAGATVVLLFLATITILAVTTSKIPERMNRRWLHEQRQDEESWKEVWKE